MKNSEQDQGLNTNANVFIDHAIIAERIQELIYYIQSENYPTCVDAIQTIQQKLQKLRDDLHRSTISNEKKVEPTTEHGTKAVCSNERPQEVFCECLHEIENGLPLRKYCWKSCVRMETE